jgi:RNA polymerase sigma-70 factor, ECF subfamily
MGRAAPLYRRGSREIRGSGREAGQLDRSLVEQARDGDPGAYDRLARVVSRRLFLIAHRILRDTDAAEDAVQQTLVTIWRELPRLRDVERFDVWSYRIVTRASIAEAKRKRRTVRIADIDIAVPSTADGMASVATRDSLERAFARMKPESRAVLVLRYYVDLPIKEIAEIIGIPYGTVGSRLHRAMSELRYLLGAEWPRPPAEAPREAGDGLLAGGRAR